MRQRRMRGRSWATQRPTLTTCRPNVSALREPLASRCQACTAPAGSSHSRAGVGLAGWVPGFRSGKAGLAAVGWPWGQFCNPHLAQNRRCHRGYHGK